MRRLPLIVLALVVFGLFPATGVSHSGRLDKKGGHYNRKTGVYHLHRNGDFTTEYTSDPDGQIQGAKVIKVIDGENMQRFNSEIRISCSKDMVTTTKLSSSLNLN